MELRVLRYFLAVAQEKNITRASQKLLVSQPTLSKQLSDLEEELGAKLFTRGHRQITLTSEGEYLRSKAEEIIDLTDKTSANIQTDQIISGELTLGAGESIGMKRIINIISDITQDYPDVKVHLVSGNAEEMESMLDRGTLDFAVLMGERTLENYHYLQIPETDQWGVLMLKDKPLTQKDVITPKDLVNKPLIMSSQALQNHRFQDWWGNLGPKMNILGTFTLVYNAELLAENSGAYMITFNNLLNNSPTQNLIFRPLSPELFEPITVIWKKNTVQSKVNQLFIRRLKASFDN
ncbi:LysR family transcriptional regulator [Companilactobacillus musae]|uniref:LysR family transcriptional regulator n=1 Tax=Companilactobacillus musae TaxID=1903258 RepID=UPI000E64878A|nr:LysR family transcriptional regulator [Companilactobacillus musae]